MVKLPIPFNNPATYPGHSGVDFGQPRGTIFRASGPGTVVTRSNNRQGGYYIWVRYDAGPLVGYHHMDSHKDCPPVGARVREGSQLGYVGNSGHSTGPHLHMEVSGHRTTTGFWQFFSRRVVGTRPAGDTITPISIEELDMSEAKYLHKSENGVEYMLIGGDTHDGWEASTNVKDGEAYGILAGKPDGSPWIMNVPYDKWVRAQKLARRLYRERKAREAAERADLAKQIAVAIPTVAGGTVDTKPLLDAITAVPAAVVNGIRNIWAK